MGGSNAAMASVLRDDDLLREILLRLGFPAFLVRAALVSKRWLVVAADPAFLRRFRDRHPPRLLGFYFHTPHLPRPRFVAVSEAPELHAAVCRARFDDGDPSVRTFDCRNGCLLLYPGEDSIYGHYVLRSPLRPTLGTVHVLPPAQLYPDWLAGPLLLLYSRSECFLSRDSSDSIVYVHMLLVRRNLSVQVHVLQSGGAWGECILAQGQLPALSNDVSMVMAAHGKLYMLTDNGYIHGLDFLAPRPQFFTIKLPNQVHGNYKLSSADDAGLFLIHVQGFQLSVWHHETDDNWELVGRFRVHVAHDRCEEIMVLGVGDNAEFVFLGLQEIRGIICVNLRSRKETVYEVTMGLFNYVRVFPFMTVWPPIFPALNNEDDHGE